MSDEVPRVLAEGNTDVPTTDHDDVPTTDHDHDDENNDEYEENEHNEVPTPDHDDEYDPSVMAAAYAEKIMTREERMARLKDAIVEIVKEELSANFGYRRFTINLSDYDDYSEKELIEAAKHFCRGTGWVYRGYCGEQFDIQLP